MRCAAPISHLLDTTTSLLAQACVEHRSISLRIANAPREMRVRGVLLSETDDLELNFETPRIYLNGSRSLSAGAESATFRHVS
jgi:hypothetical protein